MTAGHAFGGDLEAVTVASALGLAAHTLRRRCDRRRDGPRRRRHRHKLGTTAIEVAPVLDTVVALGGTPIMCVRASDGDPRGRHQGVSHHILTSAELSDRPTLGRRRCHPRPRTCPACAWPTPVADTRCADDCSRTVGIAVTTMGRTVGEDPLFFAAAAAAGRRRPPRWCGIGVARRPPRRTVGSAVAKLDRLLNLVAALIDTTVPLTADDIRERVPGYSKDSDDAFHRSFERDKDDLRELGIPIETVTVDHLEQPRAGYTILRDRYELRGPRTRAGRARRAAPGGRPRSRSRASTPTTPSEGLRKLGGIIAGDAGGAGGRHAARCGADAPAVARPVRRHARTARRHLPLRRAGAARAAASAAVRTWPLVPERPRPRPRRTSQLPPGPDRRGR